LDNLIPPVALDPTELKQIPNVVDDDTSFRGSGHGDSAASLEVKKTFIS
jgi:hypothetical protein